MDQERPKKASANPTKAFFVRMITRDLTLEDCILDLIDNSVDAAWSKEGHHPMGLDQDVDLSAYRIEITAARDRFVIRDNCGGMSLDNAVREIDDEIQGDARCGVDAQLGGPVAVE